MSAADDRAAEVRPGAIVLAGTVLGAGCLVEELALVGKAPRRVYVCTRCLKAGKVVKAL